MPTPTSNSDTHPATPRIKHSGFEDTCWELVTEAARGNILAKGELVKKYMGSINAYTWRDWELRRHAYPNAEGLLDGNTLCASFMTEVFLTEKFLTNANPDKGHFRSYLLRSLSFYIITKCRAHSTQTAGGGCTRVDAAVLEEVPDDEGLTPTRALDHQMLQNGITLVGRKLQAQWIAAGKGREFEVIYPMAMRDDEGYQGKFTHEAAAKVLKIPLGSVTYEKEKLKQAHAAGVQEYLCDTYGLPLGKSLFKELRESHALFKKFLKRRHLKNNVP
jgi:hypothetical protein